MSDSGSSQFPTRPPVTGLNILPVKGEVKAQIIDATGKLAKVDAPRTVVGEVTKINRDGTVEVKTDEGTLTLKPRDRVVPAEGQRVEVDVAAGAPPKQATLRPAPAPVQTPQPTTDVPTKSPTPTVEIQQPLPDKPVVTKPQLDPATQIKLNQQQAQQPVIKPQPVPTAPQPLQEDAIVRLTPLPPAQAKQLVEQIIQTIQSRVLNLVTLSTQAVQTTLTQEITTAVPVLPRDTIQNIVQQVTTSLTAKAPVTNLNEIVNSTALTPSIQPLRSPVETVMRQVLTQGTAFAPQPSATLSTQIMMPQANSPLPLAAMTLPIATKLSSMPVTLPTVPLDTPEAMGTTPSVIPATIKPGAFIDARVQNFTPVTASLDSVPTPATAITMNQSPATMTAQVVTVTPKQFPVLSMMMPGAVDPQLFTLNFPATNLTAGTSLTVIPQTLATVPVTPPTPLEILTGYTWPAFEELLDLEGISFPNPAAQNLSNILPNPAQPVKIPAAALLFIAAVKAGDINMWLGEKNIDAMRRSGKAEFVSRMAREFSGLNKLSSEPVNPEWRGMSIPMFGQGQIDKIHLYYRHSDHGNDQDQEQAEKGKGTRFIMDMSLTQIGDVQLDGYTRGKQLDLAVRTKQPFSAAMRYEMTRRYIHTLEIAGMEGALVFQAQPDKFIKITPRMDVLSASV